MQGSDSITTPDPDPPTPRASPPLNHAGLLAFPAGPTGVPVHSFPTSAIWAHRRPPLPISLRSEQPAHRLAPSDPLPRAANVPAGQHGDTAGGGGPPSSPSSRPSSPAPSFSAAAPTRVQPLYCKRPTAPETLTGLARYPGHAPEYWILSPRDTPHDLSPSCRPHIMLSQKPLSAPAPQGHPRP